MIIHCKYDELTPTKDLKAHPKNRNKHPDEQIDRLAKIIAYQGIRAPIVVSRASGYIVKGHGTLDAIRRNGEAQAPVVYQDFDSEEQEYAFVQSDNAIANWAELDLAGINLDIPDLGPDFDIELLGLKDFKLDPSELGEVDHKTLSDRFLVPPFSVLDARQGYWQDRKRQWLSLGIQSELGRGGGLTYAIKRSDYGKS